MDRPYSDFEARKQTVAKDRNASTSDLYQRLSDFRAECPQTGERSGSSRPTPVIRRPELSVRKPSSAQSVRERALGSIREGPEAADTCVSPPPPTELQKPLGSYLDTTRLRFSLLANRHFEDAVTTLSSDTFRVNRVGKNETAVKSPMTALCALAH
jgi:hypothetical protein